MTDRFTKIAIGAIRFIVGQQEDTKIYRGIRVDDEGRLYIRNAAGIEIEVNLQRRVLPALDAAIENGQNQSGEVWWGGASGGILIMPDAWTATDITFLVREQTAVATHPLYDESGSEVILTVAAGRAVPLPPELFAAAAFVIRSGTTGTPVNQGADRAFIILRKG